MAGDPRRPAVPLATEEDEKHVLVGSDGSIRRHYNLIYSEEDAERIRLGYCCIQCGESQVGHGKGTPFPEECAICKFRMRDKQLERYAKEWVGHIRLGPSTSLADELAALEELQEKMDRTRKRESTIIVPSGLH